MIPAAAPTRRATAASSIWTRDRARCAIATCATCRASSAPGDVVVVNDAATLPASFAGRTADGQELEVRLAGANEDGTWTAVLLGRGDWRQRTEDRPAPPALAVGDAHRVRPRPGRARHRRVAALAAARHPGLCLHGLDAVVGALPARTAGAVLVPARARSRCGTCRPFFASRPWAYEPASAGLALSAQVMDGLRGAGATIASVTHAAGLSSTGDPAIDAALPLRERYDVPEATARAVIAAARGGRPRHRRGHDGRRARSKARPRTAADRLDRPRTGWTAIRIGAGFRPRIVDALFTGLHQRGETHFELLRAFAPDGALEAALDHADRRGLSHPRVRRRHGCHMTISHDEARGGGRRRRRSPISASTPGW